MVEKSFPVKIGLEIHGYLDTSEKLFCKCSTRVLEGGDDLPNSRICPICTGTPGSKPMLPNGRAVEQLVRVALVLGCKVNVGQELVWQRKHYSWPDLPKGFQNTISGAHAVFPAEKGKFKGVRITECHLEEDPAQWNPVSGKINYNRSGLPLIEIVTEPDFNNSEEVVRWLRNLILSLSYVKAIDKMGGIKVDVNVSTYGDRAEIKNLHSVEDIRKAIDYEIARQIENYKGGVEQKRETLRYDSSKGKTMKMRDKESADDYRFIFDPDLPTLVISDSLVKSVEKSLPEMPEEKLEKLIKEFKIDKKNAEILMQNLDLVEFVEGLSEQGVSVSENISWITIELLRVLNYNKKSLEDDDVQIEPKHLAELIKLVESGEITPLKAKQIMNDFVPESFSVKEKRDEITNIDSSAVKNLCEQVINENPKAVGDYREGEKNALNFLVGQVMRKSERRADFKTVKDELEKLLDG